MNGTTTRISEHHNNDVNIVAEEKEYIHDNPLLFSMNWGAHLPAGTFGESLDILGLFLNRNIPLEELRMLFPLNFSEIENEIEVIEHEDLPELENWTEEPEKE